MSRPPEQIHLGKCSDMALVQSFYMDVGYGCEIKSDDQLLIARAEKCVIAAVRLCREFNNIVLRGMYVVEEKRGQGIGTRLLEFTSEEIGRSECWCVPHAHLADFYSRIGFRVCEGGEGPAFLIDRSKTYTAAGKNVVVMRRAAIMEGASAPD